MNRVGVLSLLFLLGCQSKSDPGPGPTPVARDAAPAAGPEPVGPGDPADDDPPDLGPPAPADPDEDVAEPAAELGAIAAWRAVVERGQYLARRGQRGVVAGRVGGAVAAAPMPGSGDPDAGVVLAQPSDLVWLIDETEGNGALGIRVRFATPPEPGARLAVRGGWALDEARRWYWQADAVTPLPAAEPVEAKDPPAAPGHVIAAVDPPGGWSKVRAPDKASPGDLMAFTVVDKPLREGAGWGVSDRKWGALMATLRLPGEHDSYGGHDLRAADERWALKKGGTYWVRVGKVRRPKDAVPVIEALTAPVRFP